MELAKAVLAGEQTQSEKVLWEYGLCMGVLGCHKNIPQTVCVCVWGAGRKAMEIYSLSILEGEV